MENAAAPFEPVVKHRSRADHGVIPNADPLADIDRRFYFIAA